MNEDRKEKLVMLTMPVSLVLMLFLLYCTNFAENQISFAVFSGLGLYLAYCAFVLMK